jgi:hypothetical protein
MKRPPKKRTTSAETTVRRDGKAFVTCEPVPATNSQYVRVCMDISVVIV